MDDILIQFEIMVAWYKHRKHLEFLEALRELILEGKMEIKGLKDGEFIYGITSDYRARIERQKEMYS